jgi:hypothetical protein
VADTGANVQINVSKPGGVEAAAAGFYQLAKSAKEAATEIKSAMSAGSAFSDSIKKQNREGRKGSRKQAAIEAAKAAEEAYEAAKEQKRAEAKQAEKDYRDKHSNRARMISAGARGGAAGIISQMGPRGGVVTAVMEAVGKVADMATKGAEIANDSYQTGAQKMRGFVSEFVPPSAPIFDTSLRLRV